MNGASKCKYMQINNKAGWTQNKHSENVLADTTSFVHKFVGKKNNKKEIDQFCMTGTETQLIKEVETHFHLLLLEHLEQLCVPRLPPRLGFPHWSPCPQTPAEMNFPKPGPHSLRPSPLQGADVSVPELSTPRRPFPRLKEMPARLGPTRTAGASQARR